MWAWRALCKLANATAACMSQRRSLLNTYDHSILTLIPTTTTPHLTSAASCVIYTAATRAVASVRGTTSFSTAHRLAASSAHGVTPFCMNGSLSMSFTNWSCLRTYPTVRATVAASVCSLKTLRYSADASALSSPWSA